MSSYLNDGVHNYFNPATLHYGTYMISGTVKNDDTPDYPVHRRVRLHDTISGQTVSEVWSDATTGSFLFNYLAFKSYYITSFDHTGVFNGVIATNVFPILMT